MPCGQSSLLKLDHPPVYSKQSIRNRSILQTDILSDGGIKSFLSNSKMHHKTSLFKDTGLPSISVFPGNRFSAIEGVSL